jgi:hypothetical protein
MSRGGRDEEGYPRRELQRICDYRVHTSATPLPEQTGEMQLGSPQLSWSLYPDNPRVLVLLFRRSPSKRSDGFWAKWEMRGVYHGANKVATCKVLLFLSSSFLCDPICFLELKTAPKSRLRRSNHLCRSDGQNEASNTSALLVFVANLRILAPPFHTASNKEEGDEG